MLFGSIAIFRTSPSSMAGTVGAIFNGALQLGSAVGISAVGSIKSSVESTHGGPTSYAGCAAAYWFLLGLVGVEFVSMLVFYRIDKEGTADEKEGPGPEAGVLAKAKKLEDVEEVVVKEKSEVEVEGEDSVEMVDKHEEHSEEVDVSELPVLQGDMNV